MTEKDEEKEKRREWDKLRGPRETEDNWSNGEERQGREEGLGDLKKAVGFR